MERGRIPIKAANRRREKVVNAGRTGEREREREREKERERERESEREKDRQTDRKRYINRQKKVR